MEVVCPKIRLNMNQHYFRILPVILLASITVSGCLPKLGTINGAVSEGDEGTVILEDEFVPDDITSPVDESRGNFQDEMPGSGDVVIGVEDAVPVPERTIRGSDLADPVPSGQEIRYAPEAEFSRPDTGIAIGFTGGMTGVEETVPGSGGSYAIPYNTRPATSQPVQQEAGVTPPERPVEMENPAPINDKDCTPDTQDKTDKRNTSEKMIPIYSASGNIIRQSPTPKEMGDPASARKTLPCDAVDGVRIYERPVEELPVLPEPEGPRQRPSTGDSSGKKDIGTGSSQRLPIETGTGLPAKKTISTGTTIKTR